MTEMRILGSAWTTGGDGLIGARPPVEMMGLDEFGQSSGVPTFWKAIGAIVEIAATSAAVYHGYKRNDSVGWAIGWGAFGFLLPIVAVPVMLAQGFGKPK